MRNTVVFLMFLLLFACSQDKKVVIPDNVLSQEEMAAVMTEVHLLEASMNLNISSAVTSGDAPDLEATTRELLKKKGITKEQYDTSFLFYTQHPKMLGEIYQLVLNDLSQLQAKVANQKDSVQTAKDSIKKP
jgi:hypothetical protein